MGASLSDIAKRAEAVTLLHRVFDAIERLGELYSSDEVEELLESEPSLKARDDALQNKLQG